MKPKFLYLTLSAFLISCSSQNKPAAIEGTWKLISGTIIQQGDTTFTDYTKTQEGIKIINPTHFSFANHDLEKGQSANPVFSAGAGTYTLKGNRYTESLEYCNHRDWEGHRFEFEVSISGDTLSQQGIEKIEDLGVNRTIIEKYVRVK